MPAREGPAQHRLIAFEEPGLLSPEGRGQPPEQLGVGDGLPDRVDNCTGGVTGAPMDCRGADTQAEFDRQTAKTVAAIAKVDADVIGVNEVENDGYGPQSAIATT